MCVCEARFLGSKPGEIVFFPSYQGVQLYRMMLFTLCYERTFVVVLICVLISLLGTGNLGSCYAFTTIG